jgi:hypothetical protein
VWMEEVRSVCSVCGRGCRSVGAHRASHAWMEEVSICGVRNRLTCTRSAYRITRSTSAYALRACILSAPIAPLMRGWGTWRSAQSRVRMEEVSVSPGPRARMQGDDDGHGDDDVGQHRRPHAPQPVPPAIHHHHHNTTTTLAERSCACQHIPHGSVTVRTTRQYEATQGSRCGPRLRRYGTPRNYIPDTALNPPTAPVPPHPQTRFSGAPQTTRCRPPDDTLLFPQTRFSGAPQTTRRLIP